MLRRPHRGGQYRGAVAPFVAVRTWDDPGVWEALIELVGPGAEIGLTGVEGAIPDGWDADHRRQGLASRLVLDVAFHIQQRGDRALLHASAANVGAIAAYEKLGFALPRRTEFAAVRTPTAPTA